MSRSKKPSNAETETGVWSVARHLLMDAKILTNGWDHGGATSILAITIVAFVAVIVGRPPLMCFSFAAFMVLVLLAWISYRDGR